MAVKLSAKLPGGDADGLAPIARELINHPHRFHVLMVLVDCQNSHVDYDSGDVVPTARIRRAEVIDRADLPAAEKLMRRALERRSGDTVLPMELEDEIVLAFQRIDPRTGELLDDPAEDGKPSDRGDQ